MLLYLSEYIYIYSLWYSLSTVATIVVTEWRTRFRREMNLLDNQKNSRAVDSLLNFETVKYYGNADFELTTFDRAILNFQVLFPPFPNQV